jgi:hypothetical protein
MVSSNKKIFQAPYKVINLSKKHADSDDSELSDTNKSSDNDFHDEEDDVLLPDNGDDSNGSEYLRE